MFCTNCGRQIADSARFCNHCGKAVAPAQPQEQHTAPYTVPVGQGDAYRAQMQQSQQQQAAPSYTVPLGYEGQNPPVKQQYPQYTVPVDKPPQQYPQYTVPVDKPPQFPQNFQQEPKAAPPVPPAPEASVPKTPAQQTTQPKRVRKLPILLAAIAVVLVVVLVAVFASGKETGPQTRVLEDRFDFTAKDMEAWLAADLKEKKIPLTWDDRENFHAVRHDGKSVGIFWLYPKKDSEKISTIRFELPRSKEYVQQYKPWFDTTVRCLLKQCHGAMTEEMLEAFLSSGVVHLEHDENTGDRYEVETCSGYGLELALLDLEKDFVAIIRPTGGDPFEAPAVKNTAAASAPTVEEAYRLAPRYTKWRFSFDEKQFLELYREQLETNGIELSEYTEVTGKYPRITHLQYNGEDVIEIKMYPGIDKSVDQTDLENLRRVEVEYCGTADYTAEELEMFVKAVALTIHTCHGDMTEELWAEIMANPKLENQKMTGNILLSTYEVGTLKISVYVGDTTMEVQCDADV